MLEVVVALSFAALPLSPQGPFLETDAGVKDWGQQYDPPFVQLIAGDTLLSLDGQYWTCLRANQPLQLAFTGPGGVPFKLAANVHPNGVNWLVAAQSGALQVLRVDCASSPQPAQVPGSASFVGPFEGMRVATVDAAGHIIAATDERILRFDPVQGPPVVLHTMAALTQQLLTAAEIANPTPHNLRVASLLNTPQGDTWMVLEWLAPTRRDVLFLLKRDGSGTLTTVLREALADDDEWSIFKPRSQVSGRASMFYEPLRQLIVLQGELNYPSDDPQGVWLPSLVAIPATGPIAFAQLATSYLPLIIPSTGEGLWVHTTSPEGFGPPGAQVQVRLTWGSLRFDGETDLDGDDLTFAREQLLGTDDFRLDSDGDRVWDHLELSRFGTDPADAGSAPPRAAVPFTGLAFSSRLSEWPEFTTAGGRFGGISPNLTPGRAYCRGVDTFECFGPTGAPVHSSPLKRFPSFAPGLAEWWLGDETGLELGTASGTQSVATIDECNARRCGAVSAVAPGLAYGPGPVISNVGLDLRRYTRTGSTSVCVREGCAPRLLGHDEVRAEAFVAKRAGHRERVYAVEADGGTSFLFDSAFFRTGGITSLWTDPQHGSLSVSMRGRVVTLDDTFIPVGESTLPFAPSEPWFRTGFGHLQTHAFMHAPYIPNPSGPCPLWTPPEVCSPPPLAKRLPWPAFTSVYGELVPVDSRARPGDVLFWVTALQDASTGYGVEAGERGGLWIHRESGATDQWISPRGLTRLADSAAAASLATTPLGVSRQLSVAPSGASMCFTDFTGRLFTLSVVDGRPTSLSLVQAANAHGCAFTDDGTLAVLEKDEISVGALRFSAASVGETDGESLHRAGTGWIALMRQGTATPPQLEARCFDASGAVTGEALHVAALTVEDGLVYWLEQFDTLSGTASAPAADQGRAFVSTIADFCAGRVAETLWVKGDRQPKNLWADLYAGIIEPEDPFLVSQGLLARRPDGLLLISSRGVDSKERGGPDAMGKFLFEFPYRLLPAFHPVNGAPELAKHTPWRRQKGSFSFVHSWPAFVTSMATVPGAVPANYGEASRAECLGRPCVPYVVGPPPVVPVDAGVVDEPDAGIDSPPPPPGMTGCGCQQGSVPVLALLLSWVLGRRRARR